MPSRCVFVEDVEFLPLDGPNVRFVFQSGDERLCFAMARSAVRKAANKARGMLDAADLVEQQRLVALRN